MLLLELTVKIFFLELQIEWSFFVPLPFRAGRCCCCCCCCGCCCCCCCCCSCCCCGCCANDGNCCCCDVSPNCWFCVTTWEFPSLRLWKFPLGDPPAGPPVCGANWVKGCVEVGNCWNCCCCWGCPGCCGCWGCSIILSSWVPILNCSVNWKLGHRNKIDKYSITFVLGSKKQPFLEPGAKFHWNSLAVCFLKTYHTRPDLFFLFSNFPKQQTIHFYNNIMGNNVHPVSGAGIRTHNLLNTSFLPLPLDLSCAISTFPAFNELV